MTSASVPLRQSDRLRHPGLRAVRQTDGILNDVGAKRCRFGAPCSATRIVSDIQNTSPLLDAPGIPSLIAAHPIDHHAEIAPESLFGTIGVP